MGKWSTAIRAVLASAVALGGGLITAGPASAHTAKWNLGTTSKTSTGAVHASSYANAGVFAYGDAKVYGNPAATPVASPVVAMTPVPAGGGYWIATAGGAVYPYGDAVSYGSTANLKLNAPIVTMAATPDGKGYWLIAIDGGVFAFGDAAFYGSTGGIKLNQPIVGATSTHNGKGYWLVAADGGIFAFGNAAFLGSTGGITLNEPVVGMAATPTGKGYWLVAADGGMFTYGDAPFKGSLGNTVIDGFVAGMASTPSGNGYWLANANGDVYHFGDAAFLGDNLNTTRVEPIATIVATPSGKGYWLLEPDAFKTTYSSPAGGNQRIVAEANSQLAADADTGYFCNPYGPCEAWCALFATWVWGHAGIPIPQMAFVGAVYDWTTANTLTLSPTALPSPGDFVYYGTGPSSTYTAVHMGIVAQVWPDGAIDTIEGDAGPATEGAYNVIMNGPFLPSDSQNYNGVPIFGYGVP